MAQTTSEAQTEETQGLSSFAKGLFSRAYNYVSNPTRTIVQAQWFKRVDQVFSNVNAKFFYEFLVHHFDELKARANDGKVSSVAFLNSIKQKLGHVWDEALVSPVMELHSKLATNALEIKQDLQQMGTEWEHTVVQVFHEKLGRPAHALYTLALQSYLSLKESAAEFSAVQWLTELRSKLGTAWDEKLAVPLSEFFAKAKQATIADLRQLHDALDWDKNGIVTLGDFMGIASSSTAVVHEAVANTWRGLLRASGNTFDYLITPAEEEKEAEETEKEGETEGDEEKEKEGKQEVCLSSLKSKVSKRLRYKALHGMKNLRKFSATRLKSLIRVDLIAYAETVIDQKARPAVKLFHEGLDPKLQGALMRLRKALDDAKPLVQPLAKPVQERLSPVAEQLRARLQQGLDRLRQGQDYALNRELVRIPGDAVALMMALPGQLTKYFHNTAQYRFVASKLAAFVAALREVLWHMRGAIPGKEQAVETTAPLKTAHPVAADPVPPSD